MAVGRIWYGAKYSYRVWERFAHQANTFLRNHVFCVFLIYRIYMGYKPLGRSKRSLFVNLSANDCLRVPAGAFSISKNDPSKEFKPLGRSKMSLWLPLGSPWGPLGESLGHLGRPWATLVVLWAGPGAPLGKVSFRVHETTVWDTEADLPEVVAASATRTLPSTRAGGQDDVSSRQTPSN